MAWFRRDNPEREISSTRSRALARARSLPDTEVLNWAETCLYGIGAALNRFRVHRDPAMLAEARMAHETLDVLFEEIANRGLQVDSQNTYTQRQV